METKVEVNKSEARSENEPVVKRTKLNEDETEEFGKNETQSKAKECKVLDNDDNDDDNEKVEFHKDGLYFIEGLTTTETTREQKSEDFKEYLEADLVKERAKMGLLKMQHSNVEKKQEETAEDDAKLNNQGKSDGKKEDSDDEGLISMEHEVPEPGFNYPLEQDASDMLNEVELDEDGNFPCVTDRYFTPYYAIDVNEPCDDVCILIHSNRICMITLAPSHVIFQKNKTITSCSYQVSEKLDRTKNKVSGKGKRGAQAMQKNSYLCRLTCSDGSVYMIRCCMNGKLMEVNERLVEDPEMLKKPPHFGGYIAIVLPSLKYHDDQLKKHLLDQKQYQEAVRKRDEKKDEGLGAPKENEKTEDDETEEKLATNVEISKTDKNERAVDKEQVYVDNVKYKEMESEKLGE